MLGCGPRAETRSCTTEFCAVCSCVLDHHLVLDADRPSQLVDVLREAGLISAEMLHEVGQPIRERIERLVDGLFHRRRGRYTTFALEDAA